MIIGTEFGRDYVNGKSAQSILKQVCAKLAPACDRATLALARGKLGSA